jgi:(R,R)-butanediol dehydrogenase/meso-butanediol dehydrogenase/diacetyl reductase
MKVAVFKEPNVLTIEERDKPQAGPGQALVKVAYCGICGSDVHAWKTGLLYPLDTVMGHEFTGTIEELGPGVPGFSIGDKVVVVPGFPCGACYHCIRGNYNLCPTSLTQQGLGLSPGMPGAFAEYVLIPLAGLMMLPLPENVSLKTGTLVEPLATPLRAVRQSRFKVGHRTVVIGAGPIGLGVIQFLKLGGAGRITVVEKSEARGEIALRLGADEWLNPDVEGDGLMDKILGLHDNVGADEVFECAGVPEAFNLAIEVAKSGGQVMLVSVSEQPTTIVPLFVAVREIEIRGILAYALDDFLYSIEVLSKGLIDDDAMISDIIPLDDILEKGFNRLVSSPKEVKILVQP